MKNLNNILKNSIGWKTKRKIVVFSVDDYGNVRLASKQARNKLDKAGLKALNRFDAYDHLETSNDLNSLYEILYSVKDKNGNPALFTAFSVPVNINFEYMEENNYNEYHYELLSETFEKLSNLEEKVYKSTWELWKEGIEKKLIHPEFHGREHFNIKVFNEKLKMRDKELLESLKNRSLTSITNSGYSTISYTAAFDFDKFIDNYKFEQIINDGLNKFKEVFGMSAVHFNPPGGREHPIIHSYLYENGINYIDTPFIKKEHQGQGKYKKILNFTGKRNNLGQSFQVRNCVFEPNLDNGVDWLNYTFRQIETAFFMKRPAIISSHRVNFCGHIDPLNRNNGLNLLKKLLNKIVTKYPDVEFMTSSDLGALTSTNKIKNFFSL